MSAKIVIVLALVAAASALPVLQYEEHEAPANYEFQYSVHDSQSGDVKQQQEARVGDVVHGSYSLVQPDGVHRIVEYSADKESGFNANVRYEGQPIAPAPVKVSYAPIAKLAYAAPVARVAYAASVARVAYAAPVTRVAYAAPVSYAAPIAKLAYAAPLAHVSYSSPVISYQH